MDNQRMFLFVALSVILLMIWQAWESDQRARRPASPATQAADGAPAAGVPQTPTSSAPAAPGVPAEAAPQGERIVVTTDKLRVEIDTVGGDVRAVALPTHPVAANKPNEPFVLMRDTGANVFYTQSGLLSAEATLPNHKSVYRAAQQSYRLADGADTLSVPLSFVASDGTQVTKTYVFHRDSYVVDLNYEIVNHATRPLDTYMYAQLVRSRVARPGMLDAAPSYTGGVIYSPENKYEKIDFDDMSEKNLARDVKNGWVAMIQHYFLGAFLPAREAATQFYSESLGGERYALGYKTLAPVAIAPGQSARLSTRLYVGPKEQSRLKKLEADGTAPGIGLTVDYGVLTFIAAPLFWLLSWIHRLVHNWGFAIILLTVLIKLVFYPLSAASYRSMAQMRKLQPRMQAMKERFGDDRQKMQQAMMELYKTEKINPLGGCLPILVQIPVFIALYWVLLESVEMRQAPFILWIKDLSSKDPYFVLPLLMGASMLAQQWLNPQPVDPIQKKVMYALPVVFTGMFAFFPAGLVLYWVVQNLLSIAQQWNITRAIEGGAKA
jgi:YidC/Oxa1 family membrane protein insertase